MAPDRQPNRIDALIATTDQLQAEVDSLTRQHDAMMLMLISVACITIATALIVGGKVRAAWGAVA